MLDWLRLIRASGLFTVASNVLAALAVVVYPKELHVELLAGEVLHNARVAFWVVAASALLYCSGMLWNDLADVDRDRRLHPRRPLPSGRIPLSHAYLAGLLLSSGALLAASQAGWRGLLGAGTVLSLILLYDFGAKSVPYLGSLCMAAVRASHAIFCLLILGDEYFDHMLLTILEALGVTTVYGGRLPPRYPLLLGGWIFGLTLISELESRRGRRWELLLGGGLLAAVLLGVLALLLHAHWVVDLQRQGRSLLQFGAILLLLLLFLALAWRVGRPWLEALRAAQRRLVGRVVGAGLGGVLLLDALVAAAFHPLIALAILLLLPPYLFASALVRMD